VGDTNTVSRAKISVTNNKNKRKYMKITKNADQSVEGGSRKVEVKENGGQVSWRARSME
jgi:hypothetical protein